MIHESCLIHGSGANRSKGYRKAISCHFAAQDSEYIDVEGTSQDKIAKEVVQVAKQKYGLDCDYKTIWKMRSRNVRD